MLLAARVPFRLVDAGFDETAAKAEMPDLQASELAGALAKGKALAARGGPADLVLGCDQVLEREDGSTLDKARSRAELAEHLRSLRGRTHHLHSAAAVALAGEIIWRVGESATLRMRDFSDRFLDQYLDEEFEEVRWSVGGYHLEGRGAQLFERVDGCHFAVLGMPLLPLLGLLREHGILLS